MNEQAERQRAFDQQWKIRWEATNEPAVAAYRKQLQKRARRLQADDEHHEVDVEAYLGAISRCVWGAAKAAGLAKETIPLPPSLQTRQRADKEVFSMGVVHARALVV